MRLLTGDAYERMADVEEESVQCVVTSPPYFRLRDYKIAGQIGLEPTVDAYINRLVRVFNRVKWATRKDGTLWVVIGDSYSAGGQNSGSTKEKLTSKQRSNGGCSYERTVAPKGLGVKELVGIPWRLAFALQSSGWYLRQDIIWAKPNPMPESVKDRCTRSHEYVFMFSRSPQYYFNNKAIQEPGSLESAPRRQRADLRLKDGYTDSHFGNPPIRATDKQRGHSRRHDGFNARWDKMTREQQCANPVNRRDVWWISPQCYSGAHFATFPESLVRLCVLAGSKPGSLVLDPFSGSGTTAKVCRELSRDFVGVELNSDYNQLFIDRVGRKWFLSNHEQVGEDWTVKQRWKEAHV